MEVLEHKEPILVRLKVRIDASQSLPRGAVVFNHLKVGPRPSIKLDQVLSDVIANGSKVSVMDLQMQSPP